MLLESICINFLRDRHPCVHKTEPFLSNLTSRQPVTGTILRTRPSCVLGFILLLLAAARKERKVAIKTLSHFHVCVCVYVCGKCSLAESDLNRNHIVLSLGKHPGDTFRMFYRIHPAGFEDLSFSKICILTIFVFLMMKPLSKTKYFASWKQVVQQFPNFYTYTT